MFHVAYFWKPLENVIKSRSLFYEIIAIFVVQSSKRTAITIAVVFSIETAIKNLIWQHCSYRIDLLNSICTEPRSGGGTCQCLCRCHANKARWRRVCLLPDASLVSSVRSGRSPPFCDVIVCDVVQSELEWCAFVLYIELWLFMSRLVFLHLWSLV